MPCHAMALVKQADRRSSTSVERGEETQGLKQRERKWNSESNTDLLPLCLAGPFLAGTKEQRRLQA